jgi:hypothetical protein
MSKPPVLFNTMRLLSAAEDYTVLNGDYEQFVSLYRDNRQSRSIVESVTRAINTMYGEEGMEAVLALSR